VEPASGGTPLWIPFVEAIVPEVQLEAGWIGITPPPGLLDLGARTDTDAQAEEAAPNNRPESR
jgi:16S rRNA processing protein RimM